MWEISLNRRVIFGKDKILVCPTILKDFNVKKVFILTYDLKAQGLLALTQKLQSENIGYILCDSVKAEPDLHVIDDAAELLKSEGCEGVIAIGGGSVMDAGKAIAMLAGNGGKIEEYQMQGKAITKPCLPLIVIPTTSGTGSEATKVSVIYNNNNGLKKSVYSPYMIADVVIFDPELTVKLPKKLTAATGMDALSHAIEAYVSLDATDVTEMYSLKALELINRSFINATNNGDNVTARGDMMLASYLAGCAITAGIGVAHIIAQPLGGLFKIPHGDACSIFLPISMETNLDYSLKKYRKIAEVLGVVNSDMDDRSAALAGIERVKEIRSLTNAPDTLRGFIDRNNFDMEETWKKIFAATGHIKCNPRPISKELICDIIEKSF